MEESTNGKGPSGLPAVLRIERWLNATSAAMALAGIAALVMAIVVVVGDIVWRRIGGHSFIGAVDLTQLSVVIAASFAIPYAFARNAHVSVDLLGAVFPDRFLLALDTLAQLLAAGLLAFLLWLSWGRMMEIVSYGDVSQDLAIPMVWFWGALIAGLGLSILICLTKAAKLVITGELSDGR